MLPLSVNGRPISPKSVPSLFSRTTILILSGVLMGIGLGQPTISSIHQQSLCASLAGMVAYLGLTVAARRRQREEIRSAFERATWNLNQRLDKFIPDGTDLPAAPHHRGVPTTAFHRFVAE